LESELASQYSSVSITTSPVRSKTFPTKKSFDYRRTITSGERSLRLRYYQYSTSSLLTGGLLTSRGENDPNFLGRTDGFFNERIHIVAGCHRTAISREARPFFRIGHDGTRETFVSSKIPKGKRCARNPLERFAAEHPSTSHTEEIARCVRLAWWTRHGAAKVVSWSMKKGLGVVRLWYKWSKNGYKFVWFSFFAVTRQAQVLRALGKLALASETCVLVSGLPIPRRTTSDLNGTQPRSNTFERFVWTASDIIFAYCHSCLTLPLLFSKTQGSINPIGQHRCDWFE